MYKEAMRDKLWILESTPLPDRQGGTVLSPLHYSDTVELVLIRGIGGEVTVNGRRYDLDHENVFYIPPKQLHASVFRSGGSGEGDMIRAFHINLELLAPFADLKKLLLADGKTLFDFSTRHTDFDGIYDSVLRILDESRPLTGRIGSLLRLFELLGRQQDEDRTAAEYNRQAIRIVDWVEDNYAGKISVQDAADHFGYNKYYFCKWIKANTGVTFLDFLNAIRVNHACAYLLYGYSVEETARSCGYSDPSYFIKVFRRLLGMTPKAYVRQNRQ